MLSVQLFTFNPFQENTYIVYNDKHMAIIFDPGCYGAPEEAILLNYINDHKLNVVQIINTHCHLDHVFGNKKMTDTFDLPLFIHPNETQMLAYAPQSGTTYGVPFDNYTGKLYLLNHGDTVKLGDDEMEVLLTPGHSPGSICLYSKLDCFVIAGDVLFRESIGRTDLPGGNHQALLSSVLNELFTLPEAVTVYPGHGPSTTIGYEKKHNPFFNRS